MANQDDECTVPINTRSPDMWALINPAVAFRGKTVLDLGCGYGDIFRFVRQAGATEVWGIDHNSDAISHILSQHNLESVRLVLCDVEQWLEITTKIYDVIICFSVLPYLSNIQHVLTSIYNHCHVALIECQYAGDGPGPEEIRDDADMRCVLTGAGFKRVARLGSTSIEGRAATRTIWKCTS